MVHRLFKHRAVQNVGYIIDFIDKLSTIVIQ